jgi:hypothetical protein
MAERKDAHRMWWRERKDGEHLEDVLVPDCVTKTYSLQLLLMWIIINNNEENVLVPFCVNKTYSLQLFYINIK